MRLVQLGWTAWIGLEPQRINAALVKQALPRVHGFFYAGGRSLLVTRWSVESESAKQLTTSTFAHYAATPLIFATVRSPPKPNIPIRIGSAPVMSVGDSARL